MKLRVLLLVFVFLAVLTAVNSCRTDPSLAPDLEIELRILQDYPGQNYQAIETGLLWSLSYLGAPMPRGSLAKTVTHAGNDRVVLHLQYAGFSANAQYYLSQIIARLKQSDEYKKLGAVDVGRFLMLTLYAPYHYYAITGAERTLDDFKQKYQGGEVQKFAVNNSALTPTERLVRFTIPATATQIAFTADDGQGSIANGTFNPSGTEVWTVMDNGQLRYAIYNAFGRLKDVSNIYAGKPGKCMWCHEIVVQPLFTTMADVPGYLTTTQYNAVIDSTQQMLSNYRQTLNGEIDFTQTQQHMYAELLYLAFMEPTVARLAQEWGLSETATAEIVKNLPTHQNAELPVGDLYGRKDVEPLAPFTGVPIPDNVRQQSLYEPDLFNLSH